MYMVMDTRICKLFTLLWYIIEILKFYKINFISIILTSD